MAFIGNTLASYHACREDSREHESSSQPDRANRQHPGPRFVPSKREPAHAVPAGTAPVGVEAATVEQTLAKCLRQAGAYTDGDQVAPCAILWTDPEHLWEGVIEGLKTQQSCLYGVYARGAHWAGGALRCIRPAPWVRRSAQSSICQVSKQQLRAVEKCP